MIRQEDVFPIGRIGKPHGIKGEVLFHFDDDVFDRLDSDYLILDIDGILVPFFMEEYRFRNESTVQVKFCHVDTQDQARELTHSQVYFERAKAEEEGDGDLSWAQIVGFSIVHADDLRPVGTIHAVDDATVNVLFEVVTPEGNEVLIPASEDFIDEVDPQQRTIKMTLPEGLLEI